MLRPLALYANAGGIACEIAMHAAPRSCQSGSGEKRATGRELYPARSHGLSHAAVPRGDGRVTQPSHACRHQTVPSLPAQQVSAPRAVSIDHDFHHLAAAVRRHTDDIYAIGERREVEV